MTTDEMLTALGWCRCGHAEHGAGFRAWDIATNGSAVAYFANAYHLRDKAEVLFPSFDAAILAAYRERFGAGVSERERTAPKSGTVADIPDDDFVARAVRAAHIGHVMGQRWVHVMAVFSLGSTYAQQLCRRFGLDPYEEVGTEPDEESDDE